MFIFDSTFNGADLLFLAGIFAAALFARAAFIMDARLREPRADRQYDEWQLAREVRASYDGLPYRGGRGWAA